jgi:hypothetical protein
LKILLANVSDLDMKPESLPSNVVPVRQGQNLKILMKAYSKYRIAKIQARYVRSCALALKHNYKPFIDDLSYSPSLPF